MHHRHPRPIPRLWLITDERMGDALWAALDRLPRGSGVVFRHHQLDPPARRRLLERVERVAMRRRLTLLVKQPDGSHLGGGLHLAPAHSRREAIAAIRGGADALLVSPVHATRSHPGQAPLGRVRFGLMVRGLPLPVIALGGVTAKRARSLMPFGVHGWAAIDAWIAH